MIDSHEFLRWEGEGEIKRRGGRRGGTCTVLFVRGKIPLLPLPRTKKKREMFFCKENLFDRILELEMEGKVMGKDECNLLFWDVVVVVAILVGCFDGGLLPLL